MEAREPITEEVEAMVVNTVPEEEMEKAIVAMDYKDAELIEASLKGMVSPNKLVYRFTTSGGEEIKGLTVLGVREVVRWLNENKGTNIIIKEVTWGKETINGEEYFVAIAVAEDANGNKWWGAATQPILITTKDGTRRVDPFALQKTISKAQRNALRGMFPEPLAAELVDRWAQEGKVVELQARDAEETQQPAKPLTGEVVQTEKPHQTEKGNGNSNGFVNPETGEINERELWRAIYREARNRFGDYFRDVLKQILLKEYRTDRFTLPVDQALELYRLLKEGEFDHYGSLENTVI